MDKSDGLSSAPERLQFTRVSEKSRPNAVAPSGHLLQVLWEKKNKKKQQPGTIPSRFMKTKMKSDLKNIYRALMARGNNAFPRTTRCSIALKRQRATTSRRSCSDKIKVQGGPICRRLRKLQRLIPGGQKMTVDALFRETANYIVSLKTQVQVLQTFSNFYSRYPHAASMY